MLLNCVGKTGYWHEHFIRYYIQYCVVQTTPQNSFFDLHFYITYIVYMLNCGPILIPFICKYLCVYIHFLTWPAMSHRDQNLMCLTSHVCVTIVTSRDTPSNVLCYRLWRHQPNVNRASEKWSWCVRIFFFVVIMGSLCVGKTIYILSWWTVYVLIRVFGCLLKHQNNPWAPKEFATQLGTCRLNSKAEWARTILS